jgi:4'-phosphopantetheinyl transferase
MAVIQDWIPEKKDYLLALLNQEELKRLRRYKIPAKQDQFLCSRGLLKLILSTYVGEEPTEVNLSTNPAGKPFLPNQSIQFNLSHSKNMLVLGFGLFDHIGVDIQEEYPISNLEILLENYFSPEEQAFLDSLDPDLRQTLFFSIWSAKEAYLKALGEGFQISPAALSVLPEGGERKSYLLSDPNNPKPDQPWTIRELDLQSGFKGAVAVDGTLNELVIIPLNPPE